MKDPFKQSCNPNANCLLGTGVDFPDMKKQFDELVDEQTHFSCDNCNRVKELLFKNGKMCCGEVKKPLIKHDRWRFCFGKNKRHIHQFDFHRKELKKLVKLLQNLVRRSEK